MFLRGSSPHPCKKGVFVKMHWEMCDRGVWLLSITWFSNKHCIKPYFKSLHLCMVHCGSPLTWKTVFLSFKTDVTLLELCIGVCFSEKETRLPTRACNRGAIYNHLQSTKGANFDYFAWACVPNILEVLPLGDVTKSVEN